MWYKTRLNYDFRLKPLCRSEGCVVEFILFYSKEHLDRLISCQPLSFILLSQNISQIFILPSGRCFFSLEIDSNTRFCRASYLSVVMRLQCHMLTVCTRPQQKYGFYIDILSRLSEFQNCAHKNVDWQEILVVPILLGSRCSWFVHSYHPAVIWSYSKRDWVLIQGLFGSVCWIMFYLN